MPDEHNRRTEAERSRPLAEAPGDGVGTGDSASPGRSSLITAVEIENFKGIGRPVRVDLRPITLLFGRNSAGKSTILHALCYAHEILSHRSVDARKTELGGDQIDLGSFHTLVHGHDRDRTVRLRFELNLEKWRVPDPLWDKIDSPIEIDGMGDSGLTELSGTVKTGWVELKVNGRHGRPELVSYEVGVNGALVGRFLATDRARTVLEFNSAHSLLHVAFRPPRPFASTMGAPEREVSAGHQGSNADRVREAAGPKPDDSQPCRVTVHELAAPLPYWQELLRFDERELERGVDYVDVPHFSVLASALLVGIGHDLQSELAAWRYIGPIRNLHPHRDVKSRTPDISQWVDGSAAWTHLLGSAGPGLIDEVSAWLARADRLDTGYALRARSILRISEGDAKLASAMREYHQLKKRFGSAGGAVDLDAWVRQQAENLVGSVEGAIRVATAMCRQMRARFADVTRVDQADYLEVEVQEAAQGTELVDRYRQHLCHWGSVDAIEVRIKARSNDEIQIPATWPSEDHHRLAEIIARLDGRDKYREEIRRLKAKDDDSAELLAECDRRLAELSGDDQSGDEVLEAKVLIENVRAKTREMAAVYAAGGNVEWSETQLKVSGIDELEARVELTRKDYRQVAGLVAKMERRDFTSAELDELAAAVGASPRERELQLVTNATGLPVWTSDIGTGISQILPVVVAALDPDRPGITAIEQPELHVHPKMQVELGDLFAQRLDQGGVFLIETHSEHLMLRLLRRIEETHSGELLDGKPPLRPEQVSVVFVEQIDGEVRTTPLRIDETGEFKDRWPHGFFHERADELF